MDYLWPLIWIRIPWTQTSSNIHIVCPICKYIHLRLAGCLKKISTISTDLNYSVINVLKLKLRLKFISHVSLSVWMFTSVQFIVT